MIQSLVTVIVAFPFCHENDVRKALIAWSDFGQINNKRAKLARNKCKRVHFMSMVVAPALDEETIAHLVIEASADGQPQQVVEHLASFVPDALRGVLGAAGFQVSPDALVAFLEEHRQEFGLGWFRTPGLVFAGTPGMSVERILDEDRLAIEIRRLLDDDRALPSARWAVGRWAAWRSRSGSARWRPGWPGNGACAWATPETRGWT